MSTCDPKPAMPYPASTSANAVATFGGRSNSTYARTAETVLRDAVLTGPGPGATRENSTGEVFRDVKRPHHRFDRDRRRVHRGVQYEFGRTGQSRGSPRGHDERGTRHANRGRPRAVRENLRGLSQVRARRQRGRT